MHEITGEIDTTQLGNTVDLEVSRIPQPTEIDGQGFVDTPADFDKQVKKWDNMTKLINPAARDKAVTPQMMKKLIKLIKASQPKHENYRLCRKKCKKFKECRCWVLDAAAQKECWESWHNERGVITGEPPSVVHNEDANTVSLADSEPTPVATTETQSAT